MVQTVIMGVINILFTLLAVFTVERWGRKPLLISGSIGMAVGAFGVALCNVVTGLPALVSVVSIMVYSASFMLLGVDSGDISQYHPGCSRRCGRCLPMDIQFHCIVYFRSDV